MFSGLLHVNTERVFYKFEGFNKCGFHGKFLSRWWDSSYIFNTCLRQLYGSVQSSFPLFRLSFILLFSHSDSHLLRRVLLLLLNLQVLLIDFPESENSQCWPYNLIRRLQKYGYPGVLLFEFIVINRAFLD